MPDGKYIFRVWAPHAKTVSLIGSFNGWNENSAVMTRLSDNESFETVADASAGDIYKFLIKSFDGRKIEKADPFAFYSDLPHSIASKIVDLPEKSEYVSEKQEDDKPINIYEVNLLSWKRHRDNSYLSFEELEKTLVPYVKSMNYTHVEFMPLTEFPFDGSWGYQVTGYFSITSRLGTPKQFRNLVDAFHRNGIKVILTGFLRTFQRTNGAYTNSTDNLYMSALSGTEWNIAVGERVGLISGEAKLIIFALFGNLSVENF